MSDDEYGRVPAGWYPDPLGLPQLRWWDNHAWTEHLSDARQPMMPTPPAAPTMFADDELPARRGRRSTESAPVASWNPVQHDSAPDSSAGGGSPAYASAPGAGSPAYGSAPGAPAFTPASTQSPVSAADPGRRGTHQTLGTTAPHLQTIEVWAIALLPMLQLLLSLLVVAAFSTGPSVGYMAAIWLGPLPIIVVLALLDARALRHRGVYRVLSGWWALLGAPVYLVGRAIRLSRISGAGYGPVGVAMLLAGLVGASVLAVPGLVIAALPAAFADEASSSIELNARSIGSAMEVSCPATPPLFIGQQLRCPAVNASGENLVVTVSLQRSNGWIAWQVDDWGIFSVVR